MMELRKDYILDRWVFLASERRKRPRELKAEEIRESKEKKAKCAFCPGNESLTPQEIGRVSNNHINNSNSGKKWSVRWFDNLYPAVREEGCAEPRTDNTFFTFASGYGKHEIIVETPSHEKQLWELSVKEINQLLEVYNNRIAELCKRPNIKYVAVFKNHGLKAGTSLAHSHTQVAAISIVPPLIREEIEACRRFGSCPYCRIIGIEKNSYRRCFENNTAVAFTPYASRFNYEIWIFPKRHVRLIEELGKDELSGIAEIMKKVLAKLREINADYNYYVHYAPGGDDLHLHIEVTPRIATWAGFEFSSGAIINSVTPEDAASFYRGEQ